ncbi:Phage protein [Bacillus cereus]|nr:Phage protein [Bacillus cereus]
MRPGYKYLNRMPLYPSQTLFNMHAEADDYDEVQCVYDHIAQHNMLQHPNYIDIVDLLGEEEPYGPYNVIGIQKRIDAYLNDCRQWRDE